MSMAHGIGASGHSNAAAVGLGADAVAEAVRGFHESGWCRFAYDPALAAWVEAVVPHAERIASDPSAQAAWLRCGGTWFAGVNILPNDTLGGWADTATGAPAGTLPTVPALSGTAIGFLRSVLGHEGLPLDAGQLSVCYPGYPAAPQPDESEAAFRFRRDRDAAHLDGLERDDARNRRLGEAHAFILGIPLAPCGAEAAPFVIYEGSHRIMRDALLRRLAGIPVPDWPSEDVTEAYVAARRRVFEACPRRLVVAAPGEAYLAHRLSIHGVGPWAGSEPQGSMAATSRPIVYFRPALPPDPNGEPDFEAWLTAP
ncbi:MAG: hypothetical protein AAF675_01480 [Pseudomonadota bacterium]